MPTLPMPNTVPAYFPAEGTRVTIIAGKMRGYNGTTVDTSEGEEACHVVKTDDGRFHYYTPYEIIPA